MKVLLVLLPALLLPGCTAELSATRQEAEALHKASAQSLLIKNGADRGSMACQHGLSLASPMCTCTAIVNGIGLESHCSANGCTIETTATQENK